MSLRVECDRCGAIFDPQVDEQAACIAVDDMTEEWQLEGSSHRVGDFCGKCIGAIRAFCKRVAA